MTSKISVKRITSFCVFLLLSAVWMVAIFDFSAQDASVSSGISGKLTFSVIDKTLSVMQTENTDGDGTDKKEKENATVTNPAESNSTDEIQNKDINEEHTKELAENNAADFLQTTDACEGESVTASSIPEIDTEKRPQPSEPDTTEEGTADTDEETYADEKVPVNHEVKKLYYEKLGSHENRVMFNRLEAILRKLAHLLSYALLGALTYFAAGSLGYIPEELRKPALISMPICIVYGISDEIHQLFVDGRHGSAVDVVIDTCGALLGTLFAVIAVRVIAKMLNKKRV